jgi:lipoprotein-anchoring transpeptidase ErfK/SrfK
VRRALSAIWKADLDVFIAGLLALAVAVTMTVLQTGERKKPRPAAPPPPPPASVVAAAGPDGKLPLDQPMRLHVVDAEFTFVEVHDANGTTLDGAIAADGRNWASVGPLLPSTKYEVLAGVTGTGRDPLRSLTVETQDASHRLHATISPGDGDVVGVGMPIIVTFDADVPVAKRAAVEQRMSVTTQPSAAGAWRWFGPRVAHWRPEVYWPAHASVTVKADMTRLDFGGGLWGEDAHTSHFTIGDAHVSVADVAAHTFTVSSDGAVVRVIPMSAGRDKYPTRGGVHIALAKEQVVTMDSQTVGIPRNSPDGYYEKVYWDVRISNGGAYVHAAPWSVGDQGERNVSHGCVNIATDQAQWFYGFAQIGDIVNVVNTPAPPVLSDAGMADWNIPWSQWVQSS